MSKLSEILCVKEDVHFKYAEYNGLYRITNGVLEYFENSEKTWKILTGLGLYKMIENSEKIEVIQEVQTALKTLNCLKKQYENNCEKGDDCSTCEYYDETNLKTITYIQSWIDVITKQENEIKQLKFKIKGFSDDN